MEETVPLEMVPEQLRNVLCNSAFLVIVSARFGSCEYGAYILQIASPTLATHSERVVQERLKKL